MLSIALASPMDKVETPTRVDRRALPSQKAAGTAIPEGGTSIPEGSSRPAQNAEGTAISEGQGG